MLHEVWDGRWYGGGGALSSSEKWRTGFMNETRQKKQLLFRLAQVLLPGAD